jgi:glucose/arabinose dehydrogenase
VSGADFRRRTLAVGPIAALALLLAAVPATAQSVKLAPYGGQAFSTPHHVTGAPGDPSRVFVVEGAGTIRLVKDGATQTTPFLTIPEVFTGCESCGLLSMAFAPDYATSGLFYVFYTRDSAVSTEQHYVRIEEFRRSTASPDVADPASRRVVLEIPNLVTAIHNGGQLQFGPDGLLYISVGDGGPQGDPNGNAQSTLTRFGKLLRVNPAGTLPFEYSIPPDNPFAGATPGADEIYSYGLRNPWRFSFDRLTGDLTIGDVGQSSREEIDFLPRGGGRGANFGWNCFEGSQPYSGAVSSCTPPPPNHIPPVLEYPNPNPGLSAVNGGYVIRDGALPSLLGRYIYADTYDVFGGELRTVQLSAGGSSGDAGLGVFATNVVSFGEDACAHIYVAAIGGTVYRLEPTSGPFPCVPQTPPNQEPPTGVAPPTGAAQPPAAAQLPAAAPTCKGIQATIVGTEGNDVRRGTSRRDVIVGLAGDDILSGLAGNDLICGGKGNDTLRGRARHDQLIGQKGNDKLYGQKGNDKLTGKVGRDTLTGGPGKDSHAAGPGRDTVRSLERPPVRERVDCGSGFDQIRADKLDRLIDCEKRLGVPGGFLFTASHLDAVLVAGLAAHDHRH